MAAYKRIIVDERDILGNRIRLSTRNRAHICDVLRMGSGDRLIASDGSGSFLVRLDSVREFDGWAVIEERIALPTERFLNITLAFGCVRPDPMEQIFRHCTELGVKSFIPVLFERCNRRPTEKKKRWENVIDSACSQSGRSIIPSVTDPVTLNQFLQSLHGMGGRIFLSATVGAQPMYAMMQQLESRELTILVGPEGGLTANEFQQVRAQSFLEASLSPLTLRTETAAIVGTGIAVSWAMNESQDIDTTNDL